VAVGNIRAKQAGIFMLPAAWRAGNDLQSAIAAPADG